MREQLTRDGLYPVVDVPHHLFREPHLRAQWTGEPPRPIQRGEYYLSGAIIAAYRAAAAIGAYHPARLVIAKPVTTYSIEVLAAEPTQDQGA